MRLIMINCLTALVKSNNKSVLYSGIDWLLIVSAEYLIKKCTNNDLKTKKKFYYNRKNIFVRLIRLLDQHKDEVILINIFEMT